MGFLMLLWNAQGLGLLRVLYVGPAYPFFGSQLFVISLTSFVVLYKRRMRLQRVHELSQST